LKQVIFLDTNNARRGGLMVEIGLLSKSSFLNWVDTVNDHLCHINNYPFISRLANYRCRYAVVDGNKSSSFKGMSLAEFEEIFTPEDIERMGRFLSYQDKSSKYGATYPIFLKEVYVKHGKVEADA